METKRVLIWGTGEIGKYVAGVLRKYPPAPYQVAGYTDSYQDYASDFEGFPFLKPEKLGDAVFDDIVIACNSQALFHEIRERIVCEFHMPQEHIIRWDTMLNRIRKRRIQEKYKDSNDPETADTLKWLDTHELSFQNQYGNSRQTFYEVFKEPDCPYCHVILNGKKMYLPEDCWFMERDGKKYLVNVVEDAQYPGSPHLYVSGGHQVKDGDVIVDAGAAEGNFALMYIERVSKAYLFEPDPKWSGPLQMTFAPWKEKVVLIPKMLGDVDNDEWVTLDAVVSENVDFVKMDIEGSETKAVLGGCDLLRRSKAKLSVCTYHRMYDAKYLTFLLESMGYRTSFSNGKFFFLYDEDIDRTLDFRHGVIYGDS